MTNKSRFSLRALAIIFFLNIVLLGVFYYFASHTLQETYRQTEALLAGALPALA